jgi:hypothetical protein
VGGHPFIIADGTDTHFVDGRTYGVRQSTRCA